LHVAAGRDRGADRAERACQFTIRSPAVDPVVQVIVLTDVVIEATVTALLLALAVQANKRFGSLDPDELSAITE